MTITATGTHEVTVKASTAVGVLEDALRAHTWQRIARERTVSAEAAELIAVDNGHPSVRAMTQARDLLATMGNERVTFTHKPSAGAGPSPAPVDAPSPAGPARVPAAAAEPSSDASPPRSLEQLLAAAAGHSSSRIRSRGARLGTLADELRDAIAAEAEAEAKRQAEQAAARAKAHRIAELKAELLKLERGVTPTGKPRLHCEHEGCTYSTAMPKRLATHTATHTQED